MSLQDRLAALISAIGADIKSIKLGYNPPSGAWAMPGNILSVAAGTPVSGKVCYWPIDIGPAGLTLQSIGVNVTTARVGGTVVEKLGLYSDNGSGGAPLVTSGGLLASGSINLSTLGVKTVSTSLTLTEGRYWLAFIYYASVAPSTAPQTTCCTNAVTLWCPNTNFPAVCRYLSTAGLTDLPVGSQAPTITADSNGSVLGLRAA